MVAVVMLVILRVTIGWHFLYEGVWKIVHADQFSAMQLMATAKGPAAPLFYAMIPDIDGRQRLAIEGLVSGKPIRNAWKKSQEDAVKRYSANLAKRSQRAEKGGSPNRDLLERFEVATEKVLWEHEDKLEAYLAEKKPQILSYFAELKKRQPGAQTSEFPADVKQWLSELRGIEKEYHGAIMAVVKEDLRDREPVPSLAALIPEIDQDVSVERVVVDGTIQNPDGRAILLVGDGITGQQYVGAWSTLKEDVIQEYQLSEEQIHQAEKTYRLYGDSVEEYLSANLEEIAGYFNSLDRYEERKAAGTNGTAHEKKRLWDELMRKLRPEAGAWLSELDGMGEDYQSALWNILDEDQKALRSMHAPLSETDALLIDLPFVKTRTQLFDLLITYGLTAIGACLLVGFCTRLAALGGVAFLISVLLVQPPWPGIYPPAPAVVGHALIVDKNFVEMIALVLLATTAVGRWGGLDYFVYHGLGRPILSRFRPENGETED